MKRQNKANRPERKVMKKMFAGKKKDGVPPKDTSDKGKEAPVEDKPEPVLHCIGCGFEAVQSDCRASGNIGDGCRPRAPGLG